MNQIREIGVLFFLLCAIGLAACTGSVREPAPDVDAVPEETDKAAVATDHRTDVERVSSTDYDQIGQTGRPIFLNSYATW